MARDNRKSFNRAERTKMNLLEWLRDPARHLKNYFELGVNCFHDFTRFDGCGQLWADSRFCVGLICVILLVLMVKHLCLDYLAHRRQVKRGLSGLDLESADAVRARRWNDISLASPILGQKESIKRIKNAKANRRISDRNMRSGNPGMGIGAGQQ
jgi:hypothetical protein